MIKAVVGIFSRNKTIYIGCLLFGWIFFFSTSLFAQQEEFAFRRISTAAGLSQSSVITINQDHLGQMWFGTRDGLNKYDGTSFAIFKNDPRDSLSISNNDILAIDEDQQGYIWVGTYYGLNRYNPQKNKFKRFFQGGENTIPNNTIWSVKVMQDGNIWIGTSAGVSIYNPTKKEFTNLSIKNSAEEGGNLVLSILQTRAGNVWLGASNGVYKVTPENETYKFEHLGPDLFVQDLIEDTQGTLWIASKYKGLFTASHDKISKFKGKGADKIYRDIRSLTFDNSGRLWLGTYEGVSQIDTSRTINKLVNRPYDENSLSRNTVKSVFTDAKGSVWVGAYYGGLNLWDKTNSNFNNYSQNSGNNALSYDVVSSIAADKDNLYFGTEGGGITVLNHHSQEASYLNKSTVSGFPSNNIKAVLLDDQELWIGTFNAGISVYDLQQKKIVPTKISAGLQEYLQGTGVYSIQKENDSILWMGSFGKGLVRYNTRTGSYHEMVAAPDGANSLSGNSIRTLLIDNKNILWVGTNKGLNRIDLKAYNTGKLHVQNYLYNPHRATGEDILSLFEDAEGEIWVGTKYKGLFKYDNNQIREVPISFSQKRVTAIHAMVEDAGHRLWLSSNQGIIAYHPEEKKATLYSQKDGLISNEFNDGAGFKLGAKIYFGGPAGISSFNPESLTENKYVPQVIFTDFKIQNVSVDYRDNNKILQKSINYTREVELGYDKANFSISYAIPNFISSSNNQYKYRLVGLEDTWNLTNNTRANYIIQKPGTYYFEVKGANNDGMWNTKPTTLAIQVNPAPWRSWWAFLIYALLIAAALYGLITIMKSKTRLQHKLDLEKLESENNRKINKAKLEFFTNISHEFRTPLTLILGPLQQLLEDYKGSNIMYKKLLVIESSANHLLQLINRLMDFRKLENNQTKLEAAKGNIVKFLQEIYLSFSEYAKDGKYTYTFESSHDKIKVYYDRSKLERVFYNLISNAFRYTPKGGQIKIRVSQEAENILIEIEDSGVGIPEENLDKIFDRFFEISGNRKKENYNQGTGIGLSIAKNIVKLHKGKIYAENKTTQGTVFTVQLPLGNAHLQEGDILKDFRFSDDISQYTEQLDKPQPVLADALEDLIIDKNKCTILVVEDNNPLRSFIKNLLKENYNILEAENGKEALKKTMHYLPDLIISDIIMPEMVGTELCATLKNNLKTSHIPIILLTSRSALVYKFEGLESGADDYISKPFNVKEFMLRIKNLLDSTQRLKEKFSQENTFAPSDLTVSSLDEKLLKKALQIVEDNISNEQFNIPAFSAELGVSRTMLFTKIKAWTNYTPNEFIMEIRMKRATQLLEQGKINISQVSYKVGFKNPKYFTKCFQKKYGQTPSQYADKFIADIKSL